VTTSSDNSTESVCLLMYELAPKDFFTDWGEVYRAKSDLQLNDFIWGICNSWEYTPERGRGVAAKFSFNNFTSSGTGITAELLNLLLAHKAMGKVYGINPLQKMVW